MMSTTDHRTRAQAPREGWSGRLAGQPEVSVANGCSRSSIWRYRQFLGPDGRCDHVGDSVVLLAGPVGAARLMQAANAEPVMMRARHQSQARDREVQEPHRLEKGY